MSNNFELASKKIQYAFDKATDTTFIGTTSYGATLYTGATDRVCNFSSTFATSFIY